MQNKPYSMLVDAAGQLMQQHAFDHLPDEKLNRLRRSFQQLSNNKTSLREQKKCSNELLSLCTEADLYTETATQQGLQQWYTVMNCFGLESNTVAALQETEAE